jgi:hypothetical protein
LKLKYLVIPDKEVLQQEDHQLSGCGFVEKGHFNRISIVAQDTFFIEITWQWTMISDNLDSNQKVKLLLLMK